MTQQGDKKEASESVGGRWVRWRRRRRAEHEARHLLKETRRLLRRHGKVLKEPIFARFNEALAAVEAALESDEPSALYTAMSELDGLVEKHLAFARKSTLREYVESIGFALLIALLLRAFVVEAFKIPSGSMIPTLKVGDHIFVNKFVYGLRLPLTHLKWFNKTPQRGDVIVFIMPTEQKDFIKRVVAVGGDTIEVREGVIILNGKPLAREPINGPCSYLDTEEGTDLAEVRQCRAYIEQLGDTRYRVVENLEGSSTPDFGPFEVPPDSVFVMGDNRDNSSDSRFWGKVPEDHIVGKALIIWWSRGQPEGFRWGRLFDLVHGFHPEQPMVLPEKLTASGVQF